MELVKPLDIILMMILTTKLINMLFMRMLYTKYIYFFKSEKDKYKEISKWSKSFKDINVYISGQSANWKDFGPQYSANIYFNLWDIYFTLAIGEKDYNWCNIETEMIKTFTDDGKINWSIS